MTSEAGNENNAKRFLNAITVEEFDAILNQIVIQPLAHEEIPVEEALGRVSYQDITSPINVPHFAKSRVDGYGVKAEATFNVDDDHPAHLRLAGSVEIGDMPSITLDSKEGCIYIPTGGCIPDGVDAVVKIEFTKRNVNETDFTETIDMYHPVTPNSGILAAEADLKKGQTIVKANTFLTTAKIGSIMAAGLPTVKVLKKRSVGLFSTGNEIVEVGKPLPPGKIYDVNRAILKLILTASGNVVSDYEIIRDEIENLKGIFSEALRNNDIVVLSGGTSKGRGDLMPFIIENHPELTLYVHGVRIKPGKPLIFAMISKKPVFVLPGNPTSVMMTCIRLLEPHLRRWNVLPEIKPKIIEATLNARVYSEFGRRELKAVILHPDPNGNQIAVPISKGSETITTLLDADGYFEIPDNVEIMEKGRTIEVILLHN